MIPTMMIAGLGMAGFILSVYLRWKKLHKSEVFVCPMRGNCLEVIHSDYSCLFGIPVELIGCGYYGLIAIGYTLRSLFPFETISIAPPLFLLSSLALLFSAYLTLVQVGRLRKLCTWCLLSAVFCLCIFLLAVQDFSSYA